MAVKHKHSEEFTTYFVTFTCYKWISLFEITTSYDLVYNWFNILKQDGIEIIGYVIMPNNVHAIIHFPSSSYNLKNNEQYILDGKNQQNISSYFYFN